MGHANIENTLRDKIAEILADYRRREQEYGDVESRDYQTADRILLLVEQEEARMVLRFLGGTYEANR